MHINFLATIFAGVEPKTFKQSMLDSQCRETMAKEFDGHSRTFLRAKRLYLANGYITLKIILMVHLHDSKHVSSFKEITNLKVLIISSLLFMLLK